MTGNPQNEYDVAVVGGGIVGLSTAMALTCSSARIRLVLLEKEPHLAVHQTGHNSGVIHSGIRYRPGSLKARLCIQGAKALISFCRQEGIPVNPCGKVVVATSPEDLPRLEEIYQRGKANGVASLSLIGPERLRELEPHAEGIRALHVPSAGVVDFSQVSRALARLVQERGGTIRTSTRVIRIQRNENLWILHTPSGEYLSRFLINCAGLHSDRLARMAGSPGGLTIVPFRGDYFELVPEKRHLVRGLIYPVPQERLPFLGVHLSRTIDGRVEAGPNAVLALKREGYRKTDVNLLDAWEILTFPGFWKMAASYWRVGLEEWYRSLAKRAFLRSVQRLVPAIEEGDLTPARSGVRAQALDRDGNLKDDFHLVQAPGALHLVNAPSPAATASLAIGEFVAQAAKGQCDKG